jgi:hypothetical protein
MPCGAVVRIVFICTSILWTHLATTNHTLVLVVSKRTFVAYAYERCWSDVAIANRALAVTFVAQTSYGYTWLFPAHHQIAWNTFSNGSMGEDNTYG